MKRKIAAFLTSCLVIMSVLIISPLSASAAEFEIDFEPISKSLYLENLDTDTVVYTKAADEKRYPASTTKIMTYIITAEHVSDIQHTNVTIKSSTLHMLDGTGSSMAGLKAKETLSVYQLLHCLMIPSGNDAALVLADFIGEGDINKFVDMMNEKAKELGCENTHFANPHGLHDEKHYTTARDMAKIAKYAMKLPYFMEICNTATSDCIGEDRYLVTTNSMIDPVRGGNLVTLPDAAQKVFDELRAETGLDCSNAGYALRFAAGFDGIEMVLSGMSSMEQMEDKLNTFSCNDGDFAPLSERELEAVQKVVDIFDSMGAIPCTGCRYCVEENHCPMEIKIPALFRAYNSMVLFGKVDPWEAYDRVIGEGSGKPGDCIECGMCEEVCPQHLEIRDLLKKVAEMFEA